MKIPDALHTRFFRNGLLVILALGIIYALFSYVFFSKNELLNLISRFSYGWLGLYEKIASLILRTSDISFSIENHTIIKGGEIEYEFEPIFLMRKFLVGLVAFIWLFPVKLSSKIYGTLVLLALHIFMTSIDMILLGSLINHKPIKDSSAYLVARTPGVLIMISFLVFWMLRYREAILKFTGKIGIGTLGIEKRIPQIIFILYLYGILNNFILGWFDFVPWINFLFVSAQEILSWLGYEAEVYINYLLGERGSIYMEKGCLGFGTMALFAAIVYLTSNRKKLVWIFITVGLIFLNFVNILRFVFLFIHLQNNDGYALAIDVHDMYNLILFGVVFILWVIWFEFFVFRKYDEENRNHTAPEA